jgi:hypothetical protein
MGVSPGRGTSSEIERKGEHFVMSKRSRFALVGVLALALCATAGLTASAAQAKNKVTRTCKSTPVPDAGPLPTQVWGQAVCEAKLGNKFKGLQVGRVELRDISLTGTEAGAIDDLTLRLVAPQGNVEPVVRPFTGSPGLLAIGPYTAKQNTSTTACSSPPCSDPFATAVPPYSNVAIQESGFHEFIGDKVKGTWKLYVFDTDNGNGTSTLAGAQLFIKFYRPPTKSSA